MMKWIGMLSGFVGRYLTYIVFLVVLWAYFMPGAFLWSVPHTVTLLGIIMFGMGMTLHAKDFKLVIQRPKEVLIGCTAHYTIMPIVAYALVLAFDLTPELAVGMVLLGSCPSGTASNVMSFLAKGGADYDALYRLGPGRPVGRSLVPGHGDDGHEGHPRAAGRRPDRSQNHR